MNNITLGSLFDGLGGWQIAAMRAGIPPVWSSEIEKFTCALTKVRFPDTVQLGDITKIDGGKIPPVDIVTMGNPCQDLSISGRREGLAGKRSGLFLRAVEIIRQMRTATNGEYPKIAIWENVPGAFTSNKGADFRTVLETLTETDIPVPRSGKWAKSGMVRSRECNIVWRTLDAQFWGVAQRRRRIFLVVDYTRGYTEEILFKPESLPWDITKSKDTEERTTAGDAASVGNASTLGNECVLNDQGGQYMNVSFGKTGTLRVQGKGHQPIILDLTHADEVVRTVTGGKTQTLNARMGTGGNQVPIIYARPPYADLKQDETAVTLRASGGCNGGGSENLVADKLLRRLTPLECERLQGLPDNWTLIDDKSCSDNARYKAIGNGMAQPCADFVIRRVAEFLRKSGKTGTKHGSGNHV